MHPEPSTTSGGRDAAAFIIWLGLALSCFALLSGTTYLWDKHAPLLWPAARYVLAPALAASAADGS
jgi:hypothetical protein